MFGNLLTFGRRGNVLHSPDEVLVGNNRQVWGMPVSSHVKSSSSPVLHVGPSSVSKQTVYFNNGPTSMSLEGICMWADSVLFESVVYESNYPGRVQYKGFNYISTSCCCYRFSYADM